MSLQVYAALQCNRRATSKTGHSFGTNCGQLLFHRIDRATPIHGKPTTLPVRSTRERQECRESVIAQEIARTFVSLSRDVNVTHHAAWRMKPAARAKYSEKCVRAADRSWQPVCEWVCLQVVLRPDRHVHRPAT